LVGLCFVHLATDGPNKVARHNPNESPLTPHHSPVFAKVPS
jgi:hypothetical protein